MRHLVPLFSVPDTTRLTYRTWRATWDDARVSIPLSPLIPPLHQGSTRNLSLPFRLSLLIAIAPLILFSLILSSCTLGPVRIGTDDTQLPTLTPIEAIRDQAARTEAAAATRAQTLASDTGECENCRAVFTTLAQDSQEREAALGGVWDPWSGHTPESAQSIPAIADAPVEVPEFTSWLAQTARRDLTIASDPARTNPQEARILAAVALGRYRSALALAQTYGLEVDTANAHVVDLNKRLQSITGKDSWSLLGSWGLDPQALENSTTLPEIHFDEAKEVFVESDDLQKAVATWDCLAQTLPQAALIDGSAPGPMPQINTLFTRNDALISAGVPDRRTLRCTLESRDADSLSMTLLVADLSLFSSKDATVRLVGAHAALEDLHSFALLPSQALVGIDTLS